MRTRAAWIIAIVADALQIVLFPIMGEGFASAASDALDVVVGIALIALLGWHFAFLPSAVTKLLPVVDILPTWTASVFFVTRRRRAAATTPQGAPRKEIPPSTS
jgi:hypothetical protein